MATGGVITKLGKNVMINRTYKSSPDYTIPSTFRMGIGTTTPVAADTGLGIHIPIGDGTVNDDGSNTLTSSDGGENSTSNTTTYKEGAGVTDGTAQNLKTDNSSATKRWYIADLASAGTKITGTKPVSLWLYIKDAAALAMFKSSGTALEIRLGSTLATNFYKITRTAAQLAVGWNWITTGTTNVEDLTETGTVAGDIDTFEIVITTNNAADDWDDTDVIYDLLRQWEVADLSDTFVTGYPVFDETNKKVTLRYYLNSLQANGFPITETGSFNTDGTPLIIDHDVFTSISKTSTDEIAIVVVNTMV